MNWQILEAFHARKAFPSTERWSFSYIINVTDVCFFQKWAIVTPIGCWCELVLFFIYDKAMWSFDQGSATDACLTAAIATTAQANKLTRGFCEVVEVSDWHSGMIWYDFIFYYCTIIIPILTQFLAYVLLYNVDIYLSSIFNFMWSINFIKVTRSSP